MKKREAVLLLLLAALSLLFSAAPVHAVSHTAYAGFAQPIPSYAMNSRDISFSSATESKSTSVSVSDYAVYRYAYASLDGQNWRPVALSGSVLGGAWLNGSATGQLSLTANDFSLSQSRLSTARNFIVVYTCSRNGDAWVCHDGWQIWQFTASLSMPGGNAVIVSVSASSDDGHVAENTLDGNLSEESRWSGDGDGAWIQYTLNDTAMIDYVRLAAYLGDQRKAYFSAAVSTDGSSWQTVLSNVSTSGETLAPQQFSFSPVQARYVRFIGHGNSQGTWNSYTEVGIEDFGIALSCIPESASVTCSGKCGQQTNNCGQTVSCSACDSCGDGSCINGETCSTCIADCGSCGDGGIGGMNVGICDANTGAVIVWSENWDGASTPTPWSPYFSSGWWDYNNYLVSVSGHGNVLQVPHGNGSVGTDSGFGNYRLPLDHAYKELYLSWDHYVQGDFAGGGGKFFGGFAGGSMCNIPKKFGDDTDGWCSMFLFQKDGVSYSDYNYFKSTYYEPGTGWPYGDYGHALSQGSWHKMTIRLRINDGDQANGIFEIYHDNVLVYKNSSVRIVNSIHPEYWIEDIYLNNFFGGSGSVYASPKDQYMRFDNLVAFYYPQGSSGYRAGVSENGRLLNVPAAISYHPAPPNKFTQAAYTEKSGTITSHCGFYLLMQHADGFETSTIQVPGATSISINVNRFDYDGGINYEGYKQILRIYEGTGTSRVLKQTYGNGLGLTSPGSVAISGNSATIEWQAGRGSAGGFSLSYTSNGAGSGTNFKCDDGYHVSNELGNLMGC